MAGLVLTWAFDRSAPDFGADVDAFTQALSRLQAEQGFTAFVPLVRETGQIGGRSQVRREQFLDHDSALQALEQARDQQLKRGFQLMFSQGTDGRR